MHDSQAELRLLVRQLRWEAEGVVSVHLEDAMGGELPPWSPGAHVDVTLPGGLVRPYSLCGDPNDCRVWRLGVLRERTGRGGSAAVHDHLRVGVTIAVRGPRNNFALVEASRYLFIAGGIGITPILPMMSQAERIGADWTLLYGGRSRSSMAFVEELQRYGDRVVLHPEDELGLLPLDRYLLDPQQGTSVYSCGPDRLLEAVEAQMVNWPNGSLHIERFRAVPATAESAADDHAFEVHAAASGVTVQVPVGVTIVRALEGAGVFPETSCEEGICGTCETSVLDGRPDHRDSLLSAEERAAGRSMMICVSRCAGERLVLDI